jgi:hypothetical protein
MIFFDDDGSLAFGLPKAARQSDYWRIPGRFKSASVALASIYLSILFLIGGIDFR